MEIARPEVSGARVTVAEPLRVLNEFNEVVCAMSLVIEE
jgi:hypothetical protein